MKSKLMQTENHDIIFNFSGMPVWSKLKSGRVPQGDELFDIINNQMSLSKSQFTPPQQENQFDLPPQKEHRGGEQELQDQAPEKEIPVTSNEEVNEFGEFDEDAKDEL